MLKQQLNSKPFYIGTARFNDNTYQENLDWKKKKNHKGSCYGFDKPITTKVPNGEQVSYNAPKFVVTTSHPAAIASIAEMQLVSGQILGKE